MDKKKVILAIETAFAGGSVSLFEKGVEIDRWIGSNAVSKSEDVLDEISFLLNKNKIQREEIKTIVVSRYAGSLTGLRIGQALARGLSKSLDCQFREVSVLKSLLIERNKSGKILTLIQINKRECWYQIFYINARGFVEEFDLAERCEWGKLKKILSGTKFDNIIFNKLPVPIRDEDNILDVHFPPNDFTAQIKIHDHLSKYIGLFKTRIKSDFSV
jgi:tRNA A37 threonylcarbamoyladenosine modification protein TsaB